MLEERNQKLLISKLKTEIATKDQQIKELKKMAVSQKVNQDESFAKLTPMKSQDMTLTSLFSVSLN